MRFSKIEILIVFLAAIRIAAAVPGQVLARVGAGSITVDDFDRHYSLYLDNHSAGDSLATKLQYLEGMIAELEKMTAKSSSSILALMLTLRRFEPVGGFFY